jgi:hypothetical protein
LEGIVHGVDVNIGENNNINCIDDNIDYSIGDDKGKCVLAFYEEGVSDNELLKQLSGTQEFFYTGSPQEFVVPPGVKELKLEVWGAQGGGTNGGLGGYSYGTLTVTTGKILHVYVGGQGSSAGIGSAAPGGWYGGGASVGGSGGPASGGGGGSFVIKTLPLVDNLPSKNDILIVAGGGGGMGYDKNNAGRSGAPGDGGGGNNNGGDAEIKNNYTFTGGGSLSAGGAGGCWNLGSSNINGLAGCSDDGSFLRGGDALLIHGCRLTGGGGGGGYYGGGGGIGGCAVDGGGGGSGYCGIDNCGGENGIRTGNGVARICWGNRIGECNGTPPPDTE